MDPIYWKDYRKQAGGLTWRLATLEDVPAIIALWMTTDKLLGPQDKPHLFAFPVLLTLVAVDEDGKIMDAVYFEGEVSVTKIGASKDGFEAFAPVVEDARNWLKAIGFRLARITIPAELQAVMAPTLRSYGFVNTCSKFAHWVRRL